jgi:ABC-type microcin C transport system duplicated ATPase subunit YejF
MKFTRDRLFSVQKLCHKRSDEGGKRRRITVWQRLCLLPKLNNETTSFLSEQISAELLTLLQFLLHFYKNH